MKKSLKSLLFISLFGLLTTGCDTNNLENNENNNENGIENTSLDAMVAYFSATGNTKRVA